MSEDFKNKLAGGIFALFVGVCIVIFCITVFLGCKKEVLPDYTGNWQTVNTTGAHPRWAYNIGCDFCRSTAELGPVWFCYDYEMRTGASADTFFVQTPTPSVLLMKLETPDLIRMQVLQTDGSMLQGAIFFLERK